MAKLMDDSVLDALFDEIISNGDQMVACETEPTTYEQASTTYMLAYISMVGGDYIKAADSNGRKCTVAAKISVSVDTPGTANWICILDTSNSKILAKTTCTAQELAEDGTVDFPAWVIHNPEPV